VLRSTLKEEADRIKQLQGVEIEEVAANDADGDQAQQGAADGAGSGAGAGGSSGGKGDVAMQDAGTAAAVEGGTAGEVAVLLAVQVVDVVLELTFVIPHVS
jgi:hypothetical protein